MYFTNSDNKKQSKNAWGVEVLLLGVSPFIIKSYIYVSYLHCGAK